MREWKWIRIENQHEAHRELADKMPQFNRVFGDRSAFTYVVRDVPTEEWNEIVRERRIEQYPNYYEFLRAYFAKEILSQPVHMNRLMQQMVTAHRDNQLSGVTGV